MPAELISIPSGTIAMKDDRTGRHWVAAIAPFSLARYPVTQDQYAAVTGAWPSPVRAPQQPVVNVSWLDAARFCNRLSLAEGLRACYEMHPDETGAAVVGDANGYRLPTESEWEYACRAGSNATRYGELDAIAWYAANSGGVAHDVGAKQPNAWGLHDMLGNVWEWCVDLYDHEVYGDYRVFRGGGWADQERGCLAANRRRSHPTFAIDDLGFRLARSDGSP
jgi:formylglycine-generating enzyme required for sulfatase activity